MLPAVGLHPAHVRLHTTRTRSAPAHSQTCTPPCNPAPVVCHHCLAHVDARSTGLVPQAQFVAPCELLVHVARLGLRCTSWPPNKGCDKHDVSSYMFLNKPFVWCVFVYIHSQAWLEVCITARQGLSKHLWRTEFDVGIIAIKR